MNDLNEGLPAEPKHVPTVKELDELVEQIFAQREKIEEMDAAVTVENKILAALEKKAADWLDELGRDKFQSPKGTVYVQEKWRFNLPQTDEDKKLFFDWLRAKGIFDKYATVNSNSYNSLLLAEWEAAKEAGEGMHFSVPGVPEPKFNRLLGVRKGK
jgi:hypothetical protein